MLLLLGMLLLLLGVLLVQLGVLLLGTSQPLSLFAQPVLARAHATAIITAAFAFGEVLELLIVGPAVRVGRRAKGRGWST